MPWIIFLVNDYIMYYINYRFERIELKIKGYSSDSIRTDFYPVVNPSSYTKSGIGYSMVGFMPEMKGKMVVIYGTYKNQIDSVRVMVE